MDPARDVPLGVACQLHLRRQRRHHAARTTLSRCSRSSARSGRDRDYLSLRMCEATLSSADLAEHTLHFGGCAAWLDSHGPIAGWRGTLLIHVGWTLPSI